MLGASLPPEKPDGAEQKRESKPRDPRADRWNRHCFVATCVFDQNALETQVLREYRDAVLLRYMELTHFRGRVPV